MAKYLDTNVLVRHFTGDPPAQARRATAFIQSAAPRELKLLDVIVAECVYVLEGPYRQKPSHVARLLASAIGHAAIEPENGPAILRSLELYDKAGMDFADAYLIARAEGAGIGEVVGFDRFDSKLRGRTVVRRVEP